MYVHMHVFLHINSKMIEARVNTIMSKHPHMATGFLVQVSNRSKVKVKIIWLESWRAWAAGL